MSSAFKIWSHGHMYTRCFASNIIKSYGLITIASILHIRKLRLQEFKGETCLRSHSLVTRRTGLSTSCSFHRHPLPTFKYSQCVDIKITLWHVYPVGAQGRSSLGSTVCLPSPAPQDLGSEQILPEEPLQSFLL